MKTKIVFALLLLITALLPESHTVGQVGGGCTNYGCIPLMFMAPVRYFGNGPQLCCLQFSEWTGRKVRHQDPNAQGDNPRRLAGRQVIFWGPDDCSVCNPPMAINQNVIAIRGDGSTPRPLNGTFGRYNCPVRNNPGVLLP